MSRRPLGVKVGDRVRVTTVHTGTITRIDDEQFLLETSPGRLISGSFLGDTELAWVVLAPPEPPVGTVVIDKNGLAWQRGDVDNEVPWWAADVDEYDRSWGSLNDERGPLTVIYEGDGRC